MKIPENHANCPKIHEYCTKTQKALKSGQKCAKGGQKWPNWRQKVTPDGAKCAHLEPLLPTLEALLATWGVPLRIFTHFYEVFVNNCAVFLKINERPRKIVQIALKFMNIAQKHRKSH